MGARCLPWTILDYPDPPTGAHHASKVLGSAHPMGSHELPWATSMSQEHPPAAHWP